MSIQQNLNTLRHPVSNQPEKSPFNAGETLQEQTSKLNVLLLGSGGRECALAWKMAQSPRMEKLFIAPGNGGTGAYGTNVAISPLDFPAIEKFAIDNAIDMIVVGNEDPLVAGIYDYFEGREGAPLIVGPSKAGAALEGSKDFAKQFMVRHSIPTARYRSFTADNLEEGYAFLEQLKAPYVLKADGLAAGKGVLIIDSLQEAKDSLKEMLGGMFGKSSATVVIEEFLSGIECSVFVLTDGNGGYRILPVAKDYKRIGEGDTGPNTYRGFIFLGLINVDGEPMVIEYNVRMGDPETEVVMLRIASDLLPLLEAAAMGNLSTMPLVEDPRYATTVMVVSGGYPGSYSKGKVITGTEDVKDAILFHAGTKLGENGELLTSGGRVIACSAYGDTIGQALANSYAAANTVDFDGKYFRRDIGADLKELM